MWQEISDRLREKIDKEEFACWLYPIKENIYSNHTLMLDVPNNYYCQQIEIKYKNLIKEIVKDITGADIEILYNISPMEISKAEPIEIKRKKTYQEKRREIATFCGSPNFRSQSELNLYIDNVKQQKEKIENVNITTSPLTSMVGKYGIHRVACFSMFDSRFFTYPNDKRKSAKVELKVRFEDGSFKIYDLYRGQLTFGGDGYGQLNTTHAKVLLAIIHIWQKKGSSYADSNNGYIGVVDLSVRELAKQLGYNKVGGLDYKRLLRYIEELAQRPMMLCDSDVNANNRIGFSFLSTIAERVLSDKGTVLRLSFNPFISKQLYERKAFLRNPECYKIKNPTAFKFLVYYDKKIFMGNKLKLEIREVANDLQLNGKYFSNLIKILTTVAKELNGYELSDDRTFNVELVKERKQYFIIAEHIVKVKTKEILNNGIIPSQRVKFMLCFFVLCIL